MLRVITWNCNMAFRKKIKFMGNYAPDILIVPECEHPDKLKFDVETKQPTDIFWYGTNLNKGLAVFSFTDFKINLLDYHIEEFRMVLPLAIKNENSSYTVFAIWANNPHDRDYQYIGQVWKALNHYQNKLGENKTLLIGDFNSNTIWDRPKREANHSTVVDILLKQGIESTYHRFLNQTQGKELHPTLFMYRHQDKPYHIDYCFASYDMIQRLKNVEVGKYDDWRGVSDHMPIIVDFE